MTDLLTAHAMRAVTRYGFFANILRSQLIASRNHDLRSETVRKDALSASYGAARVYLDTEHANARNDLLAVSASSYSDALKQLEVAHEPLPDNLLPFVDDSVDFLVRLLSAQAEVDVIALGKQMQNIAMRVDMYVRSGAYSYHAAVDQVAEENKQSLSLIFTDRTGRKYKSSKHVRDAYRWALLNAHNEIFIHTAAEHGVGSLIIDHPDKAYKWFDAHVAIVPELAPGLPSYQEVKNEIFHPSSQASLRIA